MTDGHEEGAEAPAASSKAAGPDPLIGKVISGRFKIVSLIARGGMGKVYKAEQAPLGRICALKVLNPSYDGDGDPEFHRRFFLEAATAAKLSHPNTVTVFDYGKADGEDLYYIAMEYIEGKTLYRVLREDGPFPEARVGHIARQICRSLREAHRIGVVHRDLKPANVLLSNQEDERDTVKVLDFGLVKDVSGTATEDLTQAGLFMGSPKYMSPEQITGGPVTPGTDIYSLGVVLMEMLTGKVPFDKGKSVMTLMAHVNDPPPSLGDALPGITVSPQMEAIVYRCLEKDPARRYASMDEVLTGLKAAGLAAGIWQADTNEGLPVPSLDPLALSGRNPQSAAPPSVTPSATPSGMAQGSGSGPQLPVALLPSSTELAAVQSMADPTLTPAGNTGALPRPRSQRWGVPISIAVALAIGLSAFVVLSRRAPAPAGADESAAARAPVPAAPPATSAAASATADAPAAGHLVLIDTDPAGATVSEGGIKLCSPTPCSVTFKDADKHKVQLDKQGFKTASVTIGAAEAKVSPKLDPSKPTTGAAARPVAQPATAAPPAKPGKIDDFKPSPY